MGQYYHGVILDAETRKPIMATYPVFRKMAESGLWDVCRIAYEVSKGRLGYKQRVTWAGDYSEREDYDGETLYHYIVNNSVPETMGKEYKKYPIKGSKFSEAWYNSIDAFFRQYVTDEKDIIRPEYRYLCNHDRHEWIDLMPFFTAKERVFWNPIAILTSDPTCRCGGGGDYRYKEDFEWYGAWSDCRLSSEPAPPDGYRRIAPMFEAKTRIGADDQLLESEPVAPMLEVGEPTFAERLRKALVEHYGSKAA